MDSKKAFATRTGSFFRSLGPLTVLTLTLPIGTTATAHRPLNQKNAVHALFDLEAPTGGPFPSDQFTVDDSTHNTMLRVNLPFPDCGARPSDCEDVAVLNTLDGFNMQPRLSIPFDGPIDINSVTSLTVFLISLGDTLDRHDRGGQVVGINQIVWDVGTNTLHVESDELLDQHKRYALIVTRGVRDPSGAAVEASETFRRFRQTVREPYKQALLEAVHAARRAGVQEDDIAVASVFSTQSATAILEKIRDQIKAGTPERADFNLGPRGARTVFPRSQVTDITFNQQTRVDGPLNPVRLPVESLELFGNVVGTIAFGKYLSPDYMAHPGEFILPVGTRTGTPQVQGTSEIYFNLFLPSGLPPAGGWPAAIAGHGRGGSKDFNGREFPWNIVSTHAAHGIATIIINHAGHGIGPLGTLTVSQTSGTSVTLSAGGRGIDQNRDGQIGDFEGAEPASPRILQGVRDGYIQTVGDYMQMVRVIQVGIDVEGDGSRDLDPSRLYYVGQSQGAIAGVLFMAVEPDVRAAVITAAGGPVVENRRSVQGGRPLLAGILAARQPSLLNSPGITRIEGVAVPTGPFFNENIPLRDGVPYSVVLQDATTQVIQSPVVNTVTGAMALQEWFDRAAWAGQASNPVAFARHLRRDPLPGMSARPVVFQFARGDQLVENPRTTAILRAGDLADRATLYRHDLACAENPTCVRPGHGFMVQTARFPEISRGAQEQIAMFFASNGTLVIHPEPARFFEWPIQGPLPEDLSYIP